MAVMLNGKRICGQTTRYQGQCDKCGFRPGKKNDPALTQPYNPERKPANHEGVCPKCGGRMICCVRLTEANEYCSAHARQVRSVDVNQVEAGKLASARRGLAAKLPPDLQKLYLEAFEDPRLLSLRQEVALFVTRQVQLAARLNTGESGSLWELLKEAKGKFEDGNAKLRAASDAGEAEKAAVAKQEIERSLRSMLRLIDMGGETEAAWSELLDLSERTAEMKRLQHARLKDLKQMISAEQAIELISSVVGAVRRVVRDRATLNAIEVDIAKTLRLPGPGALPDVGQVRQIEGSLAAVPAAMPGGPSVHR